jgi:aldehyde:ferredoxin oxidoreductase
MTKKLCGYTGKGLRINLTTREVKVEATFPRFKDDIGGTAIGYKVFWEEVDPKTSCYDPENKLVIAPGPLSGTGAICSGRTAITTLWPTAYPQSLIASAHVGGELAHKLKFAGWDFVIIEGESAKPIYLYINNDKVEFRDASAIWGQGTYRSASMLAQETRPDASIGTIGPAGENGVPMSNMMVDRSHSAGGIGSIMGKKKLKALVVWGDGAVHIAASPKQWEELVDQHRSILGAHTQSIVPRNPSPFSKCLLMTCCSSLSL